MAFGLLHQAINLCSEADLAVSYQELVMVFQDSLELFQRLLVLAMLNILDLDQMFDV